MDNLPPIIVSSAAAFWLISGCFIPKKIRGVHMVKMTRRKWLLEIYSKAGFNGPIRPDHAPAIDIDRSDTKSG
jgi:hypothetical protein